MKHVLVLRGLLFALVLTLALGCGTNEDASESTSAAANNESVTPQASEASDKTSEDARTILFLGNSLTAGYGLDPQQAFPALLQNRIDSLGWRFEAVNAGLSGETTAGGLRRVDWLLQQYTPDVLVLSLGGNDGLRGIDPEVTRENLQGIIDKVRTANPDVRIVLAGMLAPPNMGTEYFERFQQVFPELAEANDVELIPFLLQDVAGIASLNQSDGIHPTATGHRIVADNVWQELRPVLEDVGEQYDCLGPATASAEEECVVDFSVD